ncbi:hypothetical protein [Veillonella sp. 3627]|uniref:hypothetical protein n=1 Tax=Veillonella sp. 3627 TaxID=2490953 RepID=UPI000F8E7B5E|nr:hypothetical protein [Veillonella sp. 3627]
METKLMNLQIERSQDGEKVKFFIPDLDNIVINITDDNAEDIENLFSVIFTMIIESEQLIQFQVIDEKNDLFFEVAKDMILQLNSEIRKSEPDFERIIELNNEFGAENN